MNNYVVYMHVNKIDGKRYVGITSQYVNRRWKNGHGYYENEHFYRAICKYGWDAFEHIVVKAGLSRKEACEEERRLIKEYRTNDERYGYNKSEGGEFPASGMRHTDETKRKMSEAHKKIVFTEERKRNMSLAAKKRGNGRTGRKGKACGCAGLVRQIDIETGAVVAEYYGFYEMERITGFKKTPIQRAAKGIQKQSHGFKWEYIPRRKLNVIANKNI